MTEGRISVDEWAATALAEVGGREKELMAVFKRDWTENARINPLLFPLEQSPDQWRAHFEWFVTVETFQPEQTPVEAQMDESVLEEVEDAKTVIFQAGHTADEATVVFDASSETEAAVIMDAGPSAPAAAPGPQAESAPGPAAAPQESGAELDDLGTLIMEADEAEEPEAPQKTTEADEAASPPRPVPQQESPEAGTVVMEPEPQDDAGELDDLGTMIMEAGGDQDAGGEGEGAEAVEAGTEPAPPERGDGPEKKTRPQAPGPDVELELDDLETMEWDED